MHKSLIPLILTGGAIIIVSAMSTILYPENSSFPRVPENALLSTLGGVLGTETPSSLESLEKVTGTVKNTLKLGQIPSGNYLQKGAGKCLLKDDVWIVIKEDGTPNCGPKIQILVEMGEFSDIPKDCSVTLYRIDAAPRTVNAGANIVERTIKSGDIIDTGDCSASIKFSDASIIRLNTNTTLEIAQIPNPKDSLKTIAQLTLDRGELWGRILTTTGSYNIGNRDIVTAIRGTSLAMRTRDANYIPNIKREGKFWKVMNYPEDNPPWIDFAVVDSRKPNPVANMMNRDGLNRDLDMSQVGSFRKNGDSHSVQSVDKISLYTGSTSYAHTDWIRENTKLDIAYMNGLLHDTSSPPNKGEIQKEYDATISLSDIPKRKALCKDSEIYWPQLVGINVAGQYSPYPCQPSDVDALFVQHKSNEAAVFVANSGTYTSGTGELKKYLKGTFLIDKIGYGTNPTFRLDSSDILPQIHGSPNNIANPTGTYAGNTSLNQNFDISISSIKSLRVRRITCRDTTYWPSRHIFLKSDDESMQHIRDTLCQPNSILAQVDYTSGTGTMVFRSGDSPRLYMNVGGNGTLKPTQDGIEMSGGTKAYIWYDTVSINKAMPGGTLSGKTITIKLENKEEKSCTWTCQLGYFGGVNAIKYIVDNGWSYSGDITLLSTGETIQFRLNTNASDFKIGNSTKGDTPLQNTIKSITITE